MASKLQYAQQAQELCNTLAEVRNKARDMNKTYFDRSYNSADPFASGDIASLGILPSDVTSFVTLTEQMDKFFGNLSGLAQADYQATLDKMRTDI